jgi:hypothetical protein
MPTGEYEFDLVLSIESTSGQKQYYKSLRVKRSADFEVFYGYSCLFKIPDLDEAGMRVKCYIWNRFGANLDVNAVSFMGYKTD